MAVVDVIPGTVNTLSTSFRTPAIGHGPPARSIKSLLHNTPNLLALQTQNVPWLPFRPELGPIITGPGSGRPEFQTQSQGPFFVGGGPSVNLFDNIPGFDLGGPQPWDYSTTPQTSYQGFSPGGPTLAPVTSYPPARTSSAPWEDQVFSILGEALPLFL